MPDRNSSDRIAWIAAAASFTMVGWQVGARAVRDAVFLTEYDVSVLPHIVIASSLISVALVPLVSRLIGALTPARFVPAAFACSALSMALLSALYPRSAPMAAILLYLQVAAVGAVLISGFWSVVNEAFDPRTAKLLIGRIGAAASAGGLLRGFAAAQLAGRAPVGAILLGLAGLHVVCGLLVRRVGQAVPPQAPRPLDAPAAYGLSTVATHPYLRTIALGVVGVTVGGVLLDYVFKAAASEAYQGDELMRLFGWFYTAVAAGTLLLQSTATKRALRALGVGKSVAIHPAVLGLGGLTALLTPGVWGVAAAVAAVGMVRNSVSQVGYELLYVPLDLHLKRRAKPLIDVGVQRLADAGGGALVLAVIAIGGATEPILLGMLCVLALGTFGLNLLLDRGYVDALEQNLLARAGTLDLDDDLGDPATRHLVLQTLGAMNLAELDSSMSQVLRTGVVQRPQPVAELHAPTASVRSDQTAGRGSDALVDRIVSLRSAALDRVSKALLPPLGPEIVPHAITLLAWDEAAPFAGKALAAGVPRATGQLVDAMLDPDQPFAVRRRVPGCLVANGGQRAVDGLILGLGDPRFEVKYRCGRALRLMLARAPDLHVEAGRIEHEVLTVAAVSKPVWEGRSLLDSDEDEDEASSPASKLLRDRSNRSLDHAFTLLGLILPRDPLEVAYRGLLTDDPSLRGTALDYLDIVLPPKVRAALWPYLEPGDHAYETSVSAEDVVAKLLASHVSIQLNLAEIGKRHDT